MASGFGLENFGGLCPEIGRRIGVTFGGHELDAHFPELNFALVAHLDTKFIIHVEDAEGLDVRIALLDVLCGHCTLERGDSLDLLGQL